MTIRKNTSSLLISLILIRAASWVISKDWRQEGVSPTTQTVANQRGTGEEEAICSAVFTPYNKACTRFQQSLRHSKFERFRSTSVD